MNDFQGWGSPLVVVRYGGGWRGMADARGWGAALLLGGVL